MLWLVNVIAYVINAVVVGGSNFGWWGATNAEVSDDNPTFVTPAGWAFSIWGVIFLFELIFIIWGALPSNRDSRLVFEGVGIWFAIANVVQAAWSVVFAQELLVVSAVLLGVIAFSLLMAVIGLSSVRYTEGVTVFSLPFWGVYFPIGLHGGWTLAAALVNINVALGLQNNVSSEVAAFILSIVGAALAAAVVSLCFDNQPYMLAVAWAIAGIAAKSDYRRQKVGRGVTDGIDTALQGLWIGLLSLGVFGVIAGVRRRNAFALQEEEKSSNRPVPSAPSSEGQGLTSAIYAS